MSKIYFDFHVCSYFSQVFLTSLFWANWNHFHSGCYLKGKPCWELWCLDYLLIFLRLMPARVSVSHSIYKRSRRKGDSSLLHWCEQCGGRQGGMPCWWIGPTQSAACCPSSLSSPQRTKQTQGGRGTWGGGGLWSAAVTLPPIGGSLAGRKWERQIDGQRQRHSKIFALARNWFLWLSLS